MKQQIMEILEAFGSNADSQVAAQEHADILTKKYGIKVSINASRMLMNNSVLCMVKDEKVRTLLTLVLDDLMNEALSQLTPREINAVAACAAELVDGAISYHTASTRSAEVASATMERMKHTTQGENHDING